MVRKRVSCEGTAGRRRLKETRSEVKMGEEMWGKYKGKKKKGRGQTHGTVGAGSEPGHPPLPSARARNPTHTEGSHGPSHLCDSFDLRDI